MALSSRCQSRGSLRRVEVTSRWSRQLSCFGSLFAEYVLFLTQGGPRKWSFLGGGRTFVCACVVREIPTFVCRYAVGLFSRRGWSGPSASGCRKSRTSGRWSRPGMVLGRWRPAALPRFDVDRFFGVRGVSEVAALYLSEVCVDLSAGAADIKVRRQKYDQFGAGQLIHVVSLPSWGSAFPVRSSPRWMRLRK